MCPLPPHGTHCPGRDRAARPAPHQPVPQLPPKRDETALQEEEELQLALALSQSEAEEKERLVSVGWGWGLERRRRLVSAGWGWGLEPWTRPDAISTETEVHLYCVPQDGATAHIILSSSSKQPIFLPRGERPPHQTPH